MYSQSAVSWELEGARVKWYHERVSRRLARERNVRDGAGLSGVVGSGVRGRSREDARGSQWVPETCREMGRDCRCHAVPETARAYGSVYETAPMQTQTLVVD